MYSNAYRLERKPSEISKLRRSFLQRFNLNYKKNPTTTTTMSTTSTTPNGIYIRNVQPKRPKSPFKKFEQVALKAEATDSNYNSQLLASKKLSASESNLSFNSQNTFSKSRRQQPINESDMRSRNYTPINKLEDLVIACVDAPPVIVKQHQPNNLIYYKKKYLFDMGESNWALFSAETLDAKVKQEKERQSQLRKAQSQQNLCTAVAQEQAVEARTRSPVRPVATANRTEEKTSFINEAKDLQKVCLTKQYAEVVKVEPKLNPKVVKDDLKTSTQPVNDRAAEDDSHKVSTLEIERKWLKSSVDFELLGRYMSKLMDESVDLRKKIADGDEDLGTFKRLAEIVALKKKYASLNMGRNESELKLEKKASLKGGKTKKNGSMKAEQKKSGVSRKKSVERKNSSSKQELKQQAPTKVSSAMSMEFFPFTKKVLQMRQQRQGNETTTTAHRPTFGDTGFLTDLRRHPLANASGQ